MVGARSLAMALNRLIDARIDAANPRTAARELPSGALSAAAVRRFCARLARRSTSFAVWQLDPFVRPLSPIPVAAFVVYPYLKRFTWLCHLWLGAVDGLAPVGAWAAIKGDLPWQAWALGAGVAAGSRASTSSTRSSTSTSTASRGCTPGRRASASAARSPARVSCTSRRSASSTAAGLGLTSGSLLDRRRDRRGTARLRALARSAGRPAPARCGVLHDERRHLARVLRLRARRRAVIVGLLHPGEMGAAVGLALQCERPRGALGLRRAQRRDALACRAFRDTVTVSELARQAELILSICPPHAALDVARAGRRARRHLRRRERNLAAARRRDRGAASALRRRRNRRRPAARARDDVVPLGRRAPAAVAELFAGSLLAVGVVANASALKMAYAAWSKGTAALLLAIREVARALRRRGRLAARGARGRGAAAARASAAAATKGWRWVGEMEEIADTFAAAGEPDGFHRAAAEVYRS